MHFLQAPLLSEEDKRESSEGGLDPLGLVQVADALARRLVPGVRERMSHPRYLTAMAVATEVCAKFPEEKVARDGISPPWIVFEWLAVEGFARTANGRDPFRLPGSEKAATAMRQRVPLSAARYLKTPSVFGFHGVYRALAQELDVDSGGQLGETGYELLTTWARERKLGGFTGTSGGDGAGVCEQLRSAVSDSLQDGAVARKDGWRQWRFFREHLSPNECGPHEAALLREALLADRSAFRGDVLRFLVSSEGWKIFEQRQSERLFHAALRKSANSELGALLNAIDRYETFSRLCQDAFDDVLVEMTRASGRKVTPRGLSSIETVQVASKLVPDMFGEMLESLEPFRETAGFADSFAPLTERTDAADWVDQLLNHHLRIQRRKKPCGKSPWFERFDDGGVIIRPLYRTEQSNRGDVNAYLHAFRTGPLSSFARDLYLVSA